MTGTWSSGCSGPTARRPDPCIGHAERDAEGRATRLSGINLDITARNAGRSGAAEDAISSGRTPGPCVRPRRRGSRGLELGPRHEPGERRPADVRAPRAAARSAVSAGAIRDRRASGRSPRVRDHRIGARPVGSGRLGFETAASAPTGVRPGTRASPAPRATRRAVSPASPASRSTSRGARRPRPGWRAWDSPMRRPGGAQGRAV